MKKSILNGVVISMVLCGAIVSFAGCDTGSSSKASSPSTDTATTTPDTTTATTTPDTTTTTTTTTIPASTCKLDFESANIATLSADGLTGEVGDMNMTWGDNDTWGKATSDMVFSADTSVVTSGATSLKVTATILQNRWCDPETIAQWSLKIDLSKAGFSAPVDLTGKSVSIKAYCPAAGTLSSVKLVFTDNMGRKSQGKEVKFDTKDTWTTVSYQYVGDIPALKDEGTATSDWTVKDFDITKITGISVVAIKNGATASSSETLYVDSIDW